MFKKLLSIGIGLTALTWATTASAQYRGYAPVQYVPVQQPIQYPIQYPVQYPVPVPVYQPAPACVVPQPVPVCAPRPIFRPQPVCVPRPIFAPPCQSCFVPRPVCRPRRNHFSLGIFTPNFSFGFR